MPSDARLFLLSLLASTTTTLLIISHVLWLSLTVALRKRGRRVTYMQHHDWQKMRDEIAFVNSPEERERYERWAKFLRYTSWIWALTMVTLALLAFFIYS